MKGRIVVRLILGGVVALLGFWPSLADIGLCQGSVTQHDLDGDGRPDLTTLEFVLSSQYRTRPDQESVEGPARAYVYDGGADMKVSPDWAEATDFENDTWIFDVGADGTAELIIVFGTQADGHVAHLYADRDGDGQVTYRLVGMDVQVTESRHWSVEVIAQGAWHLHDGTLNQNLVLQTDGSNDGQPDWQVVVFDSDWDGVPEYVLMQELAASAGDTDTRLQIRVNVGNHRPEQYEDVVFWPMLVSAHRDESYNFFDHTAAISFDWAKARIDRSGILGYPIESGWVVDSLAAWQGQAAYPANFENPMTWYDLADDGDGNAELMVRQEYFPPFDPRILFGTFPLPTNDIRYSWDMDNNRTWDYKIGLVGRYPIDTVVEFDDCAIKTVPYDQFPYWVTERSWDVAFFVAAEGGGGWSSEGIYDWAGNQGFVDGQRVYSPLRDVYMTGVIAKQPRAYYQDITEGYRGEYSFEFGSQPYLYFSPIDHSLHLFGAEWGMWNVDGTEQIIYEDLDKDGYTDKWQYFIGEQPERSLAFEPPYLVYWDDNQVRVASTETGPSLFETLPPRNHEEWLALGERLATHQREYAPGDFLAMLNQSTDAQITLVQAGFRDWRLTEKGFRFVLEPQPSFQIQAQGDMSLPGILGNERAYLVEYDGNLLATPLTPPSLRLDADSVVTDPAPPQELEVAQLAVPIYNYGLEDARDVAVRATFQQLALNATMTTTVALVPGAGSAQAQFEWAPTAPGTWDVAFALGPGSPVAQGSATASAALEVAPADRVTTLDLIQLDSAPSVIWALGALFLAVLVAAAMAGLLFWRNLAGEL